MNALIRKEVRLLRPSWVLALAVLLSPALLCRMGLPVELVGPLLVLGTALPLIAALDSFGREFGQNTFSSMLALPVPRSRLWWTKVLVLAAALSTFYFAWWFSYHVCAARWPLLHSNAQDNFLTPLSSALFLLAVFSSGLWTMMVFRQIAAAVWFAILIPFVLAAVCLAVVGRFTVVETHHQMALSSLAVAYGLGGILWSWRLFSRAEDAQWTGGVVALPRWMPFKDVAGAREQARRFRPITALLGKELQLHRAMFLIAGLLAVSHVAVILFRIYGGALARHRMIEPFLAVFGGLWLLLPLLVGCTAIAEERKYGTMESQLIQPTGRRRQVMVKFAVAVGVAVVLGGLPAWFFEMISRSRGVSLMGEGSVFASGRTLVLVSVGLAGLALYASSLARNILQALGFAVALVFLGGLLVSFVNWPRVSDTHVLWQGSLGRVICYPLVVLAMGVLAWKNSRHASFAARDWILNLATLGIVIVAGIAATSGAYHRVWELFRPSDPPLGQSRFSLSDSFQMGHDGRLAILGPRGELFVGGLPRANGNFFQDGGLQSLGTNFSSAVALFSETVAIGRDGTLWASEHPAPRLIRSWDPAEALAPLAQMGTETNWLKVVRDSRHARSVFLLQKNGTLWCWQNTNRAPDRSPLLESEPRRLGKDSDWSNLTVAGHRAYFTKQNGEVWCVNPVFRTRTRDAIELDPGSYLQRWSDVEGMAWRRLASAGMFDIGIRDDGTLWAMGVIKWGPRDSLVPIDDATDWRDVGGSMRMGLALKNDGTLWRLDWSNWNYVSQAHQPKPTWFGGRSDWLAVAGAAYGIYALAADGSVWRWDALPNYRVMDLTLAPSRVPVLVGNITR